MARLIAACAEAELPATDTATAAEPQWVHLLPGGLIKGRDGRSFALDNPDAVIAASDDGADLPIDYDHQMDDPKARPASGEVKAAGWIKRLELRGDGIWGLVEWTEKARNMIQAKEYRYISPVFNHLANGKIVKLLGAGLVHRPNLALKALSSQHDANQGDGLSLIAAALDLPATAEAGEILTALNLLKTPDPARFVPIEAVSDLLNAHRQTKALMSEREADAAVEKAILDGYITPGMRSWAKALCRENPDSFEGFLKSSAPAWAHLFRPAVQRQLPVADDLADDSAAGQIATQLGIDPKRLA